MRRAWIAAVLVCATACSTESGELRIERVIPVDKDDCTIDPASDEFVASGLYDPRGIGRPPNNYLLSLKVTNTLVVPEAGPGEAQNDAEVISFDVCWFPAHPGSPGETEFEGYSDGVPDNLTCAELPENQKRTIVASAPVPAQGSSAPGVGILDLETLRSLYGPEFDPGRIPDYGAFQLNIGGANTWFYSLAAQDPSNTGGRHPAWGSFPPDISARVIIQVRANAVLQSGGTIQSNWFVFPVDVCVGCLATVCGLQTMIECVPSPTDCGGLTCPPGGDCGDGTTCQPGTNCADGSACPNPLCGTTPCVSGSWFFIGSYPDVSDVCLPAQNAGPACIELSGCPSTGP